jgi:hypothetical protein
VRNGTWDPGKPDAATESKAILARYRGLACGATYAEALKAVRAVPRDAI